MPLRMVCACLLYTSYPIDNYQLDFYVDSSWDWLPWNWLDGIGKTAQYAIYLFTNFLWTLNLYISNAVGYLIQQAYDLDSVSYTHLSMPSRRPCGGVQRESRRHGTVRWARR